MHLDDQGKLEDDNVAGIILHCTSLHTEEFDRRVRGQCLQKVDGNTDWLSTEKKRGGIKGHSVPSNMYLMLNRLSLAFKNLH